MGLCNIHTISVYLCILTTSGFSHRLAEWVIWGKELLLGVLPWFTLGHPSVKEDFRNNGCCSEKLFTLLFKICWYQKYPLKVIHFGVLDRDLILELGDLELSLCAIISNYIPLANHLTPKSHFPPLHLPGGMHLPISQCCCAHQMDLFISLKNFKWNFTFMWLKIQKIRNVFPFTSTAQPLLFFPDYKFLICSSKRYFIHI